MQQRNHGRVGCHREITDINNMSRSRSCGRSRSLEAAGISDTADTLSQIMVLSQCISQAKPIHTPSTASHSSPGITQTDGTSRCHSLSRGVTVPTDRTTRNVFKVFWASGSEIICKPQRLNSVAMKMLLLLLFFPALASFSYFWSTILLAVMTFLVTVSTCDQMMLQTVNKPLFRSYFLNHLTENCTESHRKWNVSYLEK